MFQRALCTGIALVTLSSPTLACDWGKALRNIAWVLDEDKGAKRCYDLERNCQRVRVPDTGKRETIGGCKDAFAAILHCQRQNDDAQRSIKACEAQAREYLKNNRGQ